MQLRTGMFIAAALFGGAPSASAQGAQPSGITAALEGDGDLAYYFTQAGTYLEVNQREGKVIAEKQIAGSWDCVTGNVDAAFRWSGKIYLFQGSQYFRLDDSRRCASGMPKPIIGNWPGVMWDKIETAIAYNNKAYFFRGSSYIRFDLPTDRADGGYPKTIPSGWNGLWGSDLAAALTIGGGKAAFLKGEEVTQFDIATDRADGGPRPLSTFLRRPAAAPCAVTRGGPTCGPDLFPVPADPACVGINDIVYDAKTRLPAPPGIRFKNYKAKQCKGEWPKDRPIAVQGDRGYSAKPRVGSPKVNLIVLHETTGERGYVNASGHLVHFLVDDDGTVYQLLDLALLSEHATHDWVNQRSIGIEVANNFDPGGACPSGRDCVTLKPDYPKEFPAFSKQWVLTRRPQLEALDVLVQHLIKEAKIPATWLNFGYRRPSGEELFFIGPTNSGQMVNDTPACSRSSTGRLDTMICSGGILSHSSVNDRQIDGAFPALYTGLSSVLRRTGIWDTLVAAGRDAPVILYAAAQCLLQQSTRNATDPGLARHFTPGVQNKQNKASHNLTQVMLVPLVARECVERVVASLPSLP